METKLDRLLALSEAAQQQNSSVSSAAKKTDAGGD